MRLDREGLLSEEQAITTNAVSTNVIQLSKGKFKEVGFGKPIPLLIQVTEDFATLTSLTVEIQTDDTTSFNAISTLATATLPVASLKVGARFPITSIPSGTKKYLRLRYVVTGTTATAGKITAGIVDALDNSYQDM